MPDEHRGWGERRLLGRRGLRIALGVIWLIDAGLQAEGPKFAHNYPLGTLAQSVMGEPAWVSRSIYAALDPFVSHWAWWNLASVLVEAAIGICLVTGRSTRLALGVSFVWAVAVWWLGEGFGMVPSGFALMAGGAPGPAVLYVMAGVLAWPRRDRTNTGRGWSDTGGTTGSDVNHRIWVVCWSVLWVGAASLHVPFVYSSGRDLAANLEELSAGSPPVLRSVSTWFAGVNAGHAVALASVMALVELAVGIGCLVDRAHPRLWLGIGIALSVFFWIIVQQLGGILGPDASDPGLGPLIVLLALAAWPSPASVPLSGSSAAAPREGVPVEADRVIRRAQPTTDAASDTSARHEFSS